MRLNNLIKVGDENHIPTQQEMIRIADGISKTGTAVVSDQLNIKHERIDIDVKELVLRNMELLEILVKAEVNQPVTVNVAPPLDLKKGMKKK